MWCEWVGDCYRQPASCKEEEEAYLSVYNKRRKQEKVERTFTHFPLNFSNFTNTVLLKHVKIMKNGSKLWKIMMGPHNYERLWTVHNGHIKLSIAIVIMCSLFRIYSTEKFGENIKNIGNIGDIFKIYENYRKYRKYRKYRRTWRPVLS